MGELNFSFSLHIRPQSDLCISSGSATDIGIDKAVLKYYQIEQEAGEEGGQRHVPYLIIPASTLKGKIRAECARLLRGIDVWICTAPQPNRMCPHDSDINVNRDPFYHCPICELFGSPWTKSSVAFSDAYLFKQTSEGYVRMELDIHADRSVDRVAEEIEIRKLRTAVRPGVSISRQRRVAYDERLYFSEVTHLSRGVEEFIASVSGSISENRRFPREQYLALLVAGIRAVPALGMGKSRGLGWVQMDIEPPLPPDTPIDPEIWQKEVGKIQEQINKINQDIAKVGDPEIWRK
ncbi:MAG: RAMP superfamily CRISPR-associated protein [Nitrospira sp.]|nr:RAMP superfamily CRISPR-associated protein [Nitrospira sp.]